MNTVILQKATCGPEECSELNEAHVNCVRTRTPRLLQPPRTSHRRAWPPRHAAITRLSAHSPCQKIMTENDELKGPTDPGGECRVL